MSGPFCYQCNEHFATWGELYEHRSACQGAKADAGKPRWSLLPWRAMRDVVAVLEYGARKYAPDNWRTVRPFQERYGDALLRHVVAYAEGEERDPESGLPHLAHAAVNCLFLLAGPGD